MFVVTALTTSNYIIIKMTHAGRQKPGVRQEGVVRGIYIAGLEITVICRL
jgi:hypothetical protein